MKRTVAALMRQRNLSQFPSVQESASIRDALCALATLDVGALVILRGSMLVGIFSERDFARAANLDQKLNLSSSLIPFLGRNIVYVTSNFTLEECLAVMAKTHVRHLPVLQDGTPLALLSMRHITEAIIEDRTIELGDMVKFVTGNSMAQDFKAEVSDPPIKSFCLTNRNTSESRAEIS